MHSPLATAVKLVCIWYVLLAQPPCSADEFVTNGRSLAVALQPANALNNAKPSKDASKEPIDVQAEQRALEFIAEHQPRLLKLMEFLKRKQPAAYQPALREMMRSQQRLESLAGRDQELYAIELELWQVRSELRLLAAEITVAKPERREGLTDALVRLIEKEAANDLARLTLMQQRAEKQLAKLTAEIKERTDSKEELVAKSLKNWQNKIKRQTTSKKSGK
ncbi:MAG: hypothetical protein R3C53_13400 [Pirellulaceae bacterium]